MQLIQGRIHYVPTFRILLPSAVLWPHHGYSVPRDLLGLGAADTHSCTLSVALALRNHPS